MAERGCTAKPALEGLQRTAKPAVRPSLPESLPDGSSAA